MVLNLSSLWQHKTICYLLKPLQLYRPENWDKEINFRSLRPVMTHPKKKGLFGSFSFLPYCTMRMPNLKPKSLKSQSTARGQANNRNYALAPQSPRSCSRRVRDDRDERRKSRTESFLLFPKTHLKMNGNGLELICVFSCLVCDPGDSVNR